MVVGVVEDGWYEGVVLGVVYCCGCVGCVVAADGRVVKVDCVVCDGRVGLSVVVVVY